MPTDAGPASARRARGDLRSAGRASPDEAAPAAAPAGPEAATGARPALRFDELTGAPVLMAPARQDRPNQPEAACPFCVGGLEAPDPYQVRAVPNRWPPLPDARAEVVLYTPDHERAFWQLGQDGARRVVDLWVERSAALGRRPDVGYVLVFENRGTAVGATIAHPHGQIYGLADVPPAPLTELRRAAGRGCALCRRPDPSLVVAREEGWVAWVPHASAYPYGLLLASDNHRPDLAALDGPQRDGFAALLIDVLARLDRLFDAPLPIMFWIHQRPTDGGLWPEAHLHAHLVTPLRAPGVQRYVAAGELGSGVFFNPVLPEDAAAALRGA